MNQGQIDKNIFNENEEIDYKIANVVAKVSFKLEEKINLLKILEKIENTKYNPEIFPGLILRIDKPKATFLIFPSGNMILTGLQDIPFANLAVNKLIIKCKKADIILTDPDIEITNIVASVNFHLFINLDKAAIKLENTMYEPEVFPAVIYRMVEPKAVFLIFSTGKVICTKIKNKKDLFMAVYELRSQLQNLNLMSERYESEGGEEFLFI